MENINLVEWFGYLASVIVLISFLCSSVIKLRCVSLIGSTLFGIYGFIIGSYPTGVLNLMIALINLYYLIKTKNKDEFFKILDTNQDDLYLQHFLTYYHQEIEKIHPDFDVVKDKFDVCFYVLRDMVTASVFFGEKIDKETLMISLDFVTPAYRDMKVGKYIYNQRMDKFREYGYKYLTVYPYNKDNETYLTGIGFEKVAKKDGMLRKVLM